MIIGLAALVAGLSGCGSAPGEREFRKGVKTFNEGFYVRARAAFEKSLSKRPAENIGNADAYNYLGIIYWKLGHLEQALGAFEDSQRLNPDLMEPHYNLACLLLESGEETRALELLEQARLLNTEDPTALEKLGEIHLKNRNWAEARTALHEARSRAPESVRVLTALAVSELHSQGPSEAQPHLL
ncbi:MAG: tetratricopeptide repeat protein, partial [Verrucomicrobiota bacterium]